MTAGIDRCWFFTWTTYGQWLPGDLRGSVTRVREPLRRHRFEHDTRQEPRDPSIPGLYQSAKNLLVGPPVRLNLNHATALLEQFHETVAVRRWLLIAAAIMANHIHAIVGVPGDPEPSDVLGDLKSYGSRRLNQSFVRPESGTWWTESGSKKKLADEMSLKDTVEYVRTQEFPLLIWINPIAETW